jgi:hypothetical protein
VAESDQFKWRHYQDEIILLCVRWYLRYALSYRDLQEMIRERDLSIGAMRRFIPTNSLQLNRNSSMLPGLKRVVGYDRLYLLSEDAEKPHEKNRQPSNRLPSLWLCRYRTNQAAAAFRAGCRRSER